MNVSNANAACERNSQQGIANQDFFHESRAIFSQHSNSALALALAFNDSNAPGLQGSGAPNNVYFPQRLFRMLEEIRLCRDNLAHIVSWHDSGIAFIIRNPDAFVELIMPVYFRSQTKITSFQRQLNNYGFQRVQERKHVGSLIYCHKDFSREHPHMVPKIFLKKCKMKNQQHAERDARCVKPTTSLLLDKLPEIQLSFKPPALLGRIYAGDPPPQIEQLGDDVLDEAVAELLCEPEEIRSSGDCRDESVHESAPEEGSVQDWDPDAESLEALEKLWWTRASLVGWLAA